MKNNNQGIP